MPLNHQLVGLKNDSGLFVHIDRDAYISELKAHDGIVQTYFHQSGQAAHTLGSDGYESETGHLDVFGPFAAAGQQQAQATEQNDIDNWTIFHFHTNAKIRKFYIFVL